MNTIIAQIDYLILHTHYMHTYIDRNMDFFFRKLQNWVLRAKGVCAIWRFIHKFLLFVRVRVLLSRNRKDTVRIDCCVILSLA